MRDWKNRRLKRVEHEEGKNTTANIELMQEIEELAKEAGLREEPTVLKVPSQIKIELEGKAAEADVLKADGSRAMTGPLTLSGAPTSDLHAATKKYVDDSESLPWTPQTFSDGDTTPSVSGGRVFRTTNTSATTITNFDDGADGQEIIIQVNDSNTTIQNNSNIKLQGGQNFTPAQYDTIMLSKLSTYWLEESRSLNS